jgi:hypothetical protein
MKSCLSVLLAGVTAATISITASTASAVAAEQSAGPYPMDCTKWKDKGRCEALNRDIPACKDKTDDEWRACMHLPAPAAKFTPPKPRDCSAARDKERCEAYNSALEACKDRSTRSGHRKCTGEQMQGPAPGKS